MEDIDEWKQLTSSLPKGVDIEYLTPPMLDTLRWLASHDDIQLATQDMRIQFLMLKGFIRLDAQHGYYVTEKGRHALAILSREAEPPPLH